MWNYYGGKAKIIDVYLKPLHNKIIEPFAGSAQYSLIKLNGTGALKDIYNMVERVAPDRIEKNPFYKEKIRQKLQKYFVRVEKGVYTLFDE
jgi:hypothetical protein